MESDKVNYNNISSNYNLRYDVNSLDGVGNVLRKTIDFHKPKTILEVGCGTARWLSEIDDRGIIKIGVDNSAGMLKRAKETDTCLNLVCADANFLPFAENRFDMIYCVNAIHHFKDKKEFLTAAANLLAQNGTLSIVGVDPGNKNDHWYIYDYFENVYEKDLQRFPSSDDIINWMGAIGLKQIMKNPAEHVVSEMIGEEVFSDNFLRRDQSSQLASLSNGEYLKGIEKIKHTIEKDPKAHFRVELTFNCFTGIKP